MSIGVNMGTRYIFSMEDNLEMSDVRDLLVDNESSFDDSFNYHRFLNCSQELTFGAKTQAVYNAMNQVKTTGMPGGMFFRCYDKVLEQTKSLYSARYMDGELELIVGGMFKSPDGSKASYRFTEEYCRDRYNYYINFSIDSQIMNMSKPSVQYDHAITSITNDNLYRTFNRYEEINFDNGNVKLKFYW